MSSSSSGQTHNHSLLAVLVVLAVTCTSCGGGGGGSGSTAGSVALTSLSLEQALAQLRANGIGNPTASLSVTGGISGNVSKLVAKAGAAPKVEPASLATIATDRGGYSIRTDAAGNFSLSLPASIYTFTISIPGYRTLTLRDVPVLKDSITSLGALKTLDPLGTADTDTIDPARPVAKAFVGAGRCRACHTSHYDAFNATKHTKPIRNINDPVEKANGFDVVADFSADSGSNVRTLSFTDTAVGTQPVKIELSKTAENRYFVALVDRSNGTKHTYEALRTHGGTGDWKQRFQTRIGGSWYTLPIQWNEKETAASKKWVKYNVGDWFDASGNVRKHNATRNGVLTEVFGPAQHNSYERKCFGCHGTMQGIKRVDAAASVAGEGDVGDYVAEYSSLVVSCENCHGPGYPHVDTQNPNDIVNPSKSAVRTNKLSYARANEVCGQCHIRGESIYTAPSVAGLTETTAQRKYEYPWTADNKPYRLGNDLLATSYDIEGTSKYWNPKYTRNVHSFQHHQQWLDNERGAHGFEAAQVTCFDCHDPHGNRSGGRKHQLLASTDDNALCLRCHGKDGRAQTRFLLPGESSTNSSIKLVTEHTKHSYNPTGSGGPVASRCTACHMQKTASSALRYDISDHTQRIIKPVESLDMADNGGDKSAGLVIPHSCASSTVGCHNSSSFPGGDFFVGTGDVRTDSSARGKLVAAVNGYESKFGSRKAVGTNVAGQLGTLEGTVTLGGVPMEGVRVMADRGEDFDETAEDGKFRLLLPKGTYNLFAVHPSFKTTSLEAVLVTSGAVNGNLKLVLGALGTGETQFAGSQKCKTCHADYYNRWQKTLHNRGIRYIDAADDRDPRFLVVADFGAEGVGRTIRSTESDFSALGTAQIRLLKQNGVYTVTLVNGDSSIAGTYTVLRTYGGGRGDWKQRFLVKIGNSSYILPIQWSEYGPVGPTKNPRFKTYNLTNWFNTTTKVFSTPAKAKSFEYQCTACHATGIEVEYRQAANEAFTKFSEMNTGCEKCHGPGGSHYRTGDATKILNPDKFATAIRKLDTCGQCHSRGNSAVKPDGAAATEYGVQSRTEAQTGVFRLGLYSVLETAPVFTTFFSNAVTTLDDRYWNSATWTVTSSTADVSFVPVTTQRRVSIKHHQQANDLQASVHFAAGVTCWACHDAHGTSNKANLKLPDGNLIVNGQINEQSLCLSCHGPSASASAATQRFTSVASLRTHITGGVGAHQDAEAQFSCTACHMPRTAQTVEKWDIASHTFQPIDPQVSLNMWLSGGNGNTDPTRKGVGSTASTDVIYNACTSCHSDRKGSLNALKLGVQVYKVFRTGGGGTIQ
ncbi:MAG: ammonia-forming cytochrome c nitrite reductase subunit c552 [Candidatus Wallbacteria bacterium]|nr:ammonia-forming cytochrome c nitrite reductase subunit c552 [Candidatus Wallbacteria bacterium]